MLPGLRISAICCTCWKHQTRRCPDTPRGRAIIRFYITLTKFAGVSRWIVFFDIGNSMKYSAPSAYTDGLAQVIEKVFQKQTLLWIQPGSHAILLDGCAWRGQNMPTLPAETA